MCELTVHGVGVLPQLALGHEGPSWFKQMKELHGTQLQDDMMPGVCALSGMQVEP